MIKILFVVLLLVLLFGGGAKMIVAGGAKSLNMADRLLGQGDGARLLLADQPYGSGPRQSLDIWAPESLKEGDRLYALAMKEFRLSFPGQPKADSHLRPAWDGFLAAQEQYQKAYALDPKMSIEDKIAISQREIYTCQKQMKIN